MPDYKTNYPLKYKVNWRRKVWSKLPGVIQVTVDQVQRTTKQITEQTLEQTAEKTSGQNSKQ